MASKRVIVTKTAQEKLGKDISKAIVSASKDTRSEGTLEKFRVTFKRLGNLLILV